MHEYRLRRAGVLGLLISIALAGCSNDSASDGGKRASGGAPSGGSSSGGSGGKGGTTNGGTGGGTGGSAQGGAPSGGSGGALGGTGGAAGGSGGSSGGSAYDQSVLADGPVAYWAMNQSGSEPDLTGNGNTGTYHGGAPAIAPLPNGDSAAGFDGATQYLEVASNASLSIPTTGSLAVEAWIRPDILQFPHDEGSGYVDWMGKCEQFSPTCEWEERLYDTNTQEVPNRPNRFSAYVFNPDAGLGSGADFQPAPGQVQAGVWYHVVGQYTTLSQPADCLNTTLYPGSIDIWVNGVEWDHSSHGQTGCMSQYKVVPKANNSAVDIGTMTTDSFFQGAIGKVAIYDHLLTKAQIQQHYTLMTGKTPTGSCADTCTF